MPLTAYQAKYYACELTRRHSVGDSDRLTAALLDAQVDLNPHQVEAAMFAFHSPLSKGVLLADEVGLGKTIEAGLVLSQKWAERKRRILAIEALDQTEEHLIFSAQTDQGRLLEEDTVARLMSLPAKVGKDTIGVVPAALDTQTRARQADIQRSVAERNTKFFEEEAEKLDAWSDDLKLGLERELKDLDRQIKESRRNSTTAVTLEDKLVRQGGLSTGGAAQSQAPHTL